MTTTLKILWREQQDMRRVQVVAANQALANADGRAIRDWNALTYQDLRDYVLLVFPEIKQQQDLQQNDLLLYYTDDDDEQVRITNDAELAEAFRLMEEIASMTGKSALVKITLVTKPKTQQQIEADQMPVDAQQKKTMDLFIDLSKIIEQWDAGTTANSPGTNGAEIRVPAPAPLVRAHSGAELSVPAAVPMATPVATATPEVAAKSPGEVKWETALHDVPTLVKAFKVFKAFKGRHCGVVSCANDDRGVFGGDHDI
ncbi:hypothetical protein P43SY_003350 [Pythium insidiosum]|uniref:PB1 domain-containing protein n=1 Tax=Pythium insidiosum TaxID=114742 RepID=A0AAD5M4P6_PYTIN|nr:hypothetical protein P43SY_003350 [Pythium insidiosum]